MPLDPALSTHILVPQPNQNPLGVVGEFANIQNALNQNRLFQQTFAARQRAGQILSSAPDIETGIQGLIRDPLVAPFAGAIINPIREGQQTLLSMQGMQQTQANTALETFWKSAGAAMQNPDRLPDIIKTTLATLPPGATVGPQVGQALGDIARTLTDPSIGPNGETIPMTREKYQAVLAGLMVNHSTPDAIRALTGQVTPGVDWRPVGPGGALAPVQIGGPLGAGPTAPSLLTGQPSTGPAGVRGTVGGGGLLGLTPQAQQQQEALGKSVGAIQEEVSANSKSLPDTIKRLDLLNDSLAQFQAGGGATTREGVARLMQALRNAGLPISDQDIQRVGNSSLPATQVFNAEVRPLVIGELKAAAQGTGRVMRSEVDAFLQMMSNTTDPRALLQLMNQARLSMQVGYDQSQKWPQFKQQVEAGKLPGYGMEDFYSWYNRQYKPGDLPTMTQAGTPIGPRTEARGSRGERPSLDALATQHGLQPNALTPR